MREAAAAMASSSAVGPAATAAADCTPSADLAVEGPEGSSPSLGRFLAGSTAGWIPRLAPSSAAEVAAAEGSGGALTSEGVEPPAAYC